MKGSIIMKKTISAVLALALILSLFSSFALIYPTSTTLIDPFSLESIRVTDASGYAAPYHAVDNANAFVENQAVFVIIAVKIKGQSADDRIASLKEGVRTITVTSQSLDLSTAASSARLVWRYSDDSLSKNESIANSVETVDLTKVIFRIFIDDAIQPAEDKVVMGYASFIAVSKPAVSGEIKADLTNDLSEFSNFASFPVLQYAGIELTRQSYIYSSNSLKYIIRADATGLNFVVHTKTGDEETALFAYRNAGGKFKAIVHEDSTSVDNLVTPDAAGKLTYINASNTTVDITSIVSAVNSYFGFSFANSQYPVKEEHFEAKSGGSHTILTDTYAYVTAVVTDIDADVEVAQTGDFSANIIFVLSASVVLAAAALLFIAKKVRNS